jgi:hypothetical protein
MTREEKGRDSRVEGSRIPPNLRPSAACSLAQTSGLVELSDAQLDQAAGGNAVKSWGCNTSVCPDGTVDTGARVPTVS